MRHNLIRARMVMGAASAMFLSCIGQSNAAVLTSYAAGTHGNFFELPIPRGTEVDGETFSIPQSSLASGADIYMSVSNGTTAGVTLSLYATSNTGLNGPQPTGAPLATVTNPASAESSTFIVFTPFTFTAPVPLVSGAEYALVLTSSAPDQSYFWYGDQQSSGAPYAGGNWIAQGNSTSEFAQQSTSALGFDVVNNVPEPASIALLGLAATTSLAGRRKRIPSTI